MIRHRALFLFMLMASVRGPASAAPAAGAARAGGRSVAADPSSPGPVDNAVKTDELTKNRESLLSKMDNFYSGLRVDRRGGGASLALYSESLFANDGEALTDRARTLLALCRDYALTFPDAAVGVTIVRPARSTEKDRKRALQAFRLGAEVFLPLSLPPASFYLRFASGTAEGFEGFRLAIQPVKPPLRKSETEGPTVHVHTAPGPVSPDGETRVSVSLFLFEPLRIRRWSVRLVEMKSGRLMRTFSGTRELAATLDWDGLGAHGNPARPGTYRAFLTAFPWTGGALTDSEGFVLLGPKSAGRGKPAPRDEAPEPPPNRQWAQELHFRRNSSDLAGAAQLEVRQLANNLRAFPEQLALIEGMAEERENNAESLAAARAQRIKYVLVRDYGIDPGRVKTVARSPRDSDRGGSAQKAVVSFLEPE